MCFIKYFLFFLKYSFKNFHIYFQVQALRLAGYDVMRAQLQYLREQLEKRRGNRMELDVEMHRLQSGKDIGDSIDLIQF